jgi:hypothetical protein
LAASVVCTQVARDSKGRVRQIEGDTYEVDEESSELGVRVKEACRVLVGFVTFSSRQRAAGKVQRRPATSESAAVRLVGASGFSASLGVDPGSDELTAVDPIPLTESLEPLVCTWHVPYPDAD